MKLQEEEKRKQEIGNLFEKTMTELFPNLLKGIVIKVQETQKVPKQEEPKEAHPKTHHN